MLNKLTTIMVNHNTIALPSGFSVSAFNTAKPFDQALLQQVGELRYKVWKQQGMQMPSDNNQQTLIDTIDQNAMIWMVHKQDNDQSKLVATARMNIYDDLSQSPTAYMHEAFNDQYPLPAATFTRLVVSNECRGLKIGSLLDQLRVEQARLMGLKSVLLMCPRPRAASLQKYGFENLGKAAPSRLWPDADWILMKLRF